MAKVWFITGGQLDVNDHEQIYAVVDKAVRHFGRIDVLVNNSLTELLFWVALRCFFRIF
jgi:NAD(P)-dependent dehydrogenase (short-subunit alcohol dehydrogenase family)